MKKGFTLMEVLAVLLVLAVVVSMTAPVLRSARLEIKNAQAKTATKKLAEAVKSYYQNSRGREVQACFTPTTSAGLTVIQTAASSCVSPSASGKPNKSTTATVDSTAAPLFACGFLSYKDFVSLPYTFCSYKPATLTADNPDDLVDRFYAVAYGTTDAGAKYQPAKGFIFVDGRMKALDTYDD